MLNCIKQHYRQPLTMISCIWSWLHDLWLVLKICRFSLLSLIVGFIFFGLADQGIDILRAQTESDKLSPFLLFYACIWLWALSIWYWARHILTFKHIYEKATNTENKERARSFINEVPRLLGALGFIALWFAFKKTSGAYANVSIKDFAISPGVMSMVYLLSAVAFYLFARYRRNIFGKLLNMPKVDDLYSNLNQNFTDLPKWPKAFANLLIILTIVAFCWTTIDPVSAGNLGTANLLLIAAANGVFFGTALVFYGDKYRVPIFILLLVWAFLISAWNDNHTMRSLGKLTTKNGVNIQADFQTWLDKRLPAWKKAHPNKPFPIFLVAAEGGGIRAAYWTASLLGALQDANPNFTKHVYAMSGVSGGSLGIATFAGLVKAGNHQASFTDACKEKKKSGDKKFSYEKCSDAFLQTDFLAPVAGRMLYGDLLQRFLPVAFSMFDRATALELSWQSAWQKLTHTKYFDESLTSLYKDKVDKATVPALFLNTTWVEKGTRVLSSNLVPDKHFTAIQNLYNITNKYIRLSTAVHNSARFSYVSPAGTVKKADGEIWGHLVDGGYFENSGTTTLHEVYDAIKEQAGKKWSQLLPIVIMITNDPKLDDAAITDPNPIANEVLSPLNGLINTRSGRGIYARGVMRKAVSQDKGIFKEFGLQNVRGPVPLGWTLSDAAMKTMKDRLNCYINELPNGNPLNMQAGQTCNSGK